MAEGERFFLRPSKPVDEMTDEELDAFADALVLRISQLGRSVSSGSREEDDPH